MIDSRRRRRRDAAESASASGPDEASGIAPLKVFVVHKSNLGLVLWV